MKIRFEPRQSFGAVPTIHVELTETETHELCGEIALRATGRDCSPIELSNMDARVTMTFPDLTPVEYYAIFSPLIDKVIGICTSAGRPSVVEEEPGCLFVLITRGQFDKYGDDPEDEWTQLEQIGIEKPKK